MTVPDDWVDLTIYTFIGPAGSDPSPWVRVTVDSRTVDSTVEEFAERCLRATLEAAPASRQLRRDAVPLGDRSPAVRAEIRWSPAEGIRLYSRMLFALWGPIGVTATSQLTKKTRATQGPIVDGVMRSLRRREERAPASPDRAETIRFEADRFVLDLPRGWSEATVFTLAQPDDSRFRRNLTIRRDRSEAPDTSFEAWVEDETRSLESGVVGFDEISSAAFPVKDGKPASRLDFHRASDLGSTVRQRQVFAERAPWRYVLTLTTEPRLSEADEGACLAMLASFAATAPS